LVEPGEGAALFSAQKHVHTSLLNVIRQALLVVFLAQVEALGIGEAQREADAACHQPEELEGHYF
jgi:hypothetical protein